MDWAAHYVPTPAFAFSAPEDATHPAGAIAAVVLRVYSAPSEGSPDWYRGPVCDVLLLETHSTMRNVIIPGGGGARNQRWDLPAETDREIADAILVRGEAPQFTDENAAKWGAYILISFMASGIPYVDNVLAHPAARTSMVPRATDREEFQAPFTDEDGADEIDWEEQLPSEITGEGAAPVPRIPAHFWQDNERARAAYTQSYQQYWENGAAEAWWYGDAATRQILLHVDARDVESRAAASGAAAGWEDGRRFGLYLRQSSRPNVETRYEGAPYQHTAIHPEPDEADEDDGTGGAAVPAQATGKDYTFEANGVRALVRQDGTVIVDSRAAGGVRVQASSQGVRLTASGAIVDVGAGGNGVDVRAAEVRIHAGGADASQSIVRGEVLDDFLSADFSVATAFGPSGPSVKRFMTSTVGDVLRKEAKVS